MTGITTPSPSSVSWHHLLPTSSQFFESDLVGPEDVTVATEFAGNGDRRSPEILGMNMNSSMSLKNHHTRNSASKCKHHHHHHQHSPENNTTTTTAGRRETHNTTLYHEKKRQKHSRYHGFPSFSCCEVVKKEVLSVHFE
ncbi:hypothetical protein L6452_30926 [Arctium lappa]|uniref:Uncharacterized protein n=1 Tax=Arctium lappa TaxID=4217 RepID=A0ACB8ZIM5_ARCLA|nr:hypothetical protein L6452_30926 [Arctium lappa]